MVDHRSELRDINSAVRQRFDQQKRVLSFNEYLQEFVEHPWRHSRDAARYLRDCLEHYGRTTLPRPTGETSRWKLFDLDFERSAFEDEAPAREHLVGHEQVQSTVARILDNFSREGRANRLILLHGPNGSAKSTFVACLMRGLEHYSHRDEGAMYQFSWIFPRNAEGQGIGFGSAEPPKVGDSYAHLPEDRIDVKVPSELREHPLLLLPLEERRALIRRVYREQGIDDHPPDWLWSGQLGQKNQQILQALLTSCRGDLEQVLAHVQVERFYIARRYRRGAVTIGPQMAVDAHERQITADHSLNSLPASLSSLTLYEPFGELVDASGGMIEYSDLLKRPLDAWKYLLLAIENGEVSLSMSSLPINAVLMATSNELHLGAFKEHHEYNSFRGRIQLVRMPYLLDYTQEQQIYDAQIVPQVRRHVAPHATFVAALWAVLTRLRRPRADRYEDTSRGKLAADLTPLEKAELYAKGTVPERMGSDEANLLRTGIGQIRDEAQSQPDYEGLTGASPREIRGLLLDAGHDTRYACLSPLAVLDEIEAFCQRNDYEFLKQTPDRGYHDHRGFIEQVRQRWLDRVDEELRSCTGLVDETQYTGLFHRYVTHVSNWTKNERVYNRHTGQYEDPDAELMESVEEMLGVADQGEAFRHNLIGSVAAHALDHPGSQMNYASLFPRYIAKLKEAYYQQRRKLIADAAMDVLALLSHGKSLDDAQREQAQNVLSEMRSQHGYNDDSVRDAVGELVRMRYGD